MKSGEPFCSEDEMMYRFFLGSIPALIVVYLILTKTNLGPEWMQECQIHRLTGLYCPGCGATRAVVFLLHGQIGKSLFYYPAIVPAAAFVLLYVGSHTVSKITSGRIRGIHYRKIYLFLGVALIVLNVVWKNYCYLVKHIALIP